MIEWWIADGGEGPDEIHSMGVVDRSGGRYHVFGLVWGSDGPPAEREEFAGISGPWPADGSLGSRPAISETFSLSETPEPYSAEEHVERILAVTASCQRPPAEFFQ